MMYASVFALATLQVSANTDFQDSVDEAHQRFSRAQEKIERSASQSQSIPKAVKKMLAENRETSPYTQLRPVEYQLKPAYHNWKKPTKYRTHRDYTVFLDYGNSQHAQKLQQQFKQWLKGGYYIIRSETTDINEGDKRGTLQKIRIVK